MWQTWKMFQIPGFDVTQPGSQCLLGSEIGEDLSFTFSDKEINLKKTQLKWLGTGKIKELRS